MLWYCVVDRRFIVVCVRIIFFLSIIRRHSICALVPVVQTCALPILLYAEPALPAFARLLHDRAAALGYRRLRQRRRGPGGSADLRALPAAGRLPHGTQDRKSTRLNSSH